MNVTRNYVCFTSAFRGDSAPCISHETFDGVKTGCGRLVADAATFEPDSNNLEPDCLICRVAASKVRVLAERIDEWLRVHGSAKAISGMSPASVRELAAFIHSAP